MILSDSDGAYAKALGIYNETSKTARRVTFYIGANGKILHIDASVKAQSHGADIAKKLGELGVAKKK